MSAVNVSVAEELLGHWMLTSDARDTSGNNRNGKNSGVQFQATGTQGKAAAFDGRGRFIQVESPKLQKLGTRAFSISVWVKTAAKLNDNLGTIISQYDPKTRKGFQLSIKNHAGVTSSQSNYRHLQFGIDNAKQSAAWKDHGRLGNAILVYSMAVYKNQLFAGTCVSGKEEAGHLYRFDGRQWIDCGTPDNSNAVTSLAVLNNQLYVATGKYRLGGSSLQESQNNHLGGKVYRYTEDGQFIACGSLPKVEAINGMVVYEDKLYASSMYAPASFFRYDGGTKWTACGTPDGKRVESMTVYNGYIFASGYDQGAVYRYDGKTWKHVGQVGQATQTYGFTTYQGELYVSEWPHAEVYRYAGENNWVLAGRLGTEKEAMPLAVYNGKMYSGTLPLAEVYRYEGKTAWKKVGRIDLTPDVRYRRVWSMAVFQGRLFAGTLPAGHVHSFSAGKNVTYDTALASGWVHVVAVKGKNRLQLYVDGKQVAKSTSFNAADYDLTTTSPLKIGFGAHDYFNGSLKDLRIHNRAISNSEVQELYKAH